MVYFNYPMINSRLIFKLTCVFSKKLFDSFLYSFSKNKQYKDDLKKNYNSSIEVVKILVYFEK